MGSHIIDSMLFTKTFASSEMKRIFSDEGLIKKWLDAEAALARAEGKYGVIPEEAAEEISKKANLSFINIDRLGNEISHSGHPLIPIIKQLSEACDKDHGQFVHFGATTQDIMDTATILQIKDGFMLIEDKMCYLLRTLIKQADKYRDTVMPGRTHGQHALPITLGYKFSVWLEEIGRHFDRFQNLKERVLIGQFSGAVGTFASVSDEGFRIQDEMMQQLGLNSNKIAWHTSRDNIVEIAGFMALLIGTAGKIANEIAALQKTEVKELEEPFKKGQIGSSTMPHKRNPVACQNVLTMSKVVRNNAALLLNNMDHEHERDMAKWQVEWEALPEIFIMSDKSLSTIQEVLADLEINEEQMKENLFRTNGLILSESIMMALAKKIGKLSGHHLIFEASMKAINEDKPLAEVVKNNKQIAEFLTADEIDELLRPINYVGRSKDIIETSITNAKERLGGDEET